MFKPLSTLQMFLPGQYFFRAQTAAVLCHSDESVKPEHVVTAFFKSATTLPFFLSFLRAVFGKILDGGLFDWRQ